MLLLLVWRAFLSVACVWGFFLTLRQSWPSNLVQEKTIVLLSDHCTSLLVQVRDDWNCVSLFWNIVHVLSTEHTLPLSFQRRISVLFDSWWLILFPQLRSGLWSFEFSSSDTYEVLQMFSILKNSHVHYFEWFLGRTMPRRSDAEQNLVISTRTILPGSHLKAYHLLIIELDPIQRRNLGRRHFVSLHWINLIDLVLLHEHRLLENAHRSCKQSLFFVRIGRLFEHAAPRHLLFFGSAHACREAFSMQTQSSHQAYRSQGNLIAPPSILMS